MSTRIDSPIKVGAIFEQNGRLTPVWFVWQGRKYTVRGITYTWGEREGDSWMQNFSVTDGANLYQISYSTDDLHWRLIALEEGG